MIRDYLKHEVETEVVMDRKYNWVAIVGQKNERCCHEQEDYFQSPQRR